MESDLVDIVVTSDNNDNPEQLEMESENVAENMEETVNENVQQSETDSPPPKRRAEWQETLIKLVATQQQQLAELVRQNQTHRELSPTASTSNICEVRPTESHQMQFKVTSFDPDKSAYSMEEWLEDVAKLKTELKVSDYLMIAKAGEALRGKAYRYYCDWRPLNRTWEIFRNDLIVAFPDKETPGIRAFTAATLRSHDCDSLSDYGTQKIRAIKRFYNALPWNTVISMIEYGLDHFEARSAIRIQNPGSEKELLKLLSEFDARRLRFANPVNRFSIENKKREQGKLLPKVFKGNCFNCGLQGHQENSCTKTPRKEEKQKPNTSTKPSSTAIPVCDHCKKMGHTEPNCWNKHGKPKKALVMKK